MVIAVGLVALAIDKWVHRRGSVEQSTARELAEIHGDLAVLDAYTHTVGKQGYENANALGRLQTELTMRAVAAEKDHERFDNQISENTRRIDELYRVMKRNGGST